MDLVARLVLGVVLLAAAAAKVRERSELPDVLAAHGVPRRLRGPVAAALTLVEAGLGALLVTGTAARAAAYGALALGASFVVELARLRLRGITSLRCGCFGAKERPTSLLLLRASGLTALAGLAVVAAERGIGTPSRDTAVMTAIAVLAAAVIVLAALVLALYRQVGVLALRIAPRTALELAEEGPEIGAPAPPFSALARRGGELVAFFSEDCRLCRELAPAVDALAREGLRIHVVYEGAEPVVLSQWRVPGTPFFVHVIDGSVVAKGLVNSLEQLDHLLVLGRARREHAAA